MCTWYMPVMCVACVVYIILCKVFMCMFVFVWVLCVHLAYVWCVCEASVLCFCGKCVVM